MTWVTSAEKTHMMTTAPIINNPALYLHPINYNEKPTNLCCLFASKHQRSEVSPTKIFEIASKVEKSPIPTDRNHFEMFCQMGFFDVPWSKLSCALIPGANEEGDAIKKRHDFEAFLCVGNAAVKMKPFLSIFLHPFFA